MKKTSKQSKAIKAQEHLKTFTFICPECGKEHSGEPSFSFPAPVYYMALSEEEKKSDGYLNSDICTIAPDDHFIRAVLEIPIKKYSIPFTWGVWVSQSKKNFDWYVDHFNEDTSGNFSFGWFCNFLPYYPDTISIETVVHFQKPGQRPKIEIKECDHELYHDFSKGLSLTKAYKIIQKTLHGAN